MQRRDRSCSSLECNSLGWIEVARVPNTAEDADSGWDTVVSVAVVDWDATESAADAGCCQSSYTPSPALGAVSPLPLPPSSGAEPQNAHSLTIPTGHLSFRNSVHAASVSSLPPRPEV